MTNTDDTKLAAAHTPEPWEHADNGLIYGQCGEGDDEAPFVADVIEDSAMQALGMLPPVEAANARRICAAINACEGLSTEALEQGVIRELVLQVLLLADHLESRPDHFSEALRQLRLREARAVLTKAKAASAGRRPA
jgi:hypothetical protein